MGKKIRLISTTFAVVLVISFLLLPLLAGSDKALSNDHPWADDYGFSTGSQSAQRGYSEWHNAWKYFSGVYTNRTTTSPSIDYGIHVKGWSNTNYYNATASTAYYNLSGNAYFAAFNHSNGHVFDFGSSTYLADLYRSGDPPPPTYMFVNNQRNMDDMKFALLLGCETADNYAGDGRHLSWEFRCDRGVDAVVGFTNEIGRQEGNYWPGHVFCQEFSRGSQLYGYHVADSCAWAKLWTFRHCGNNYWGLDSCTIWGNGYTYINSPGDGIYEGRP